MKKSIITLLIACAGLMASAETHLHGGVEAGWNISYPVDASQVRNGFRIGVFGELELTRLWSLDASLRFSLKPWKNTQTINGGETWTPDLQYRRISYTANPYVLELPVHAAVNFQLAKGLRMNVAAGPYLGVGLFGNGKYRSLSKTTDGSELLDKGKTSDIYKDEPGNMKRFEVGIDTRLGLEIQRHYLVSLGYQFQFNDPARTGTPIGQSQIFNLSVGYKF